MSAMKKMFLYIILSVSFQLLHAQQAVEGSLSTLLNDDMFVSSDVSMVVYDLDCDTLLFEHRSHKLVRPASVQKVLTSVVALEKLGSGYTFDTRLFRQCSDEALNYYVKGVMDPLFNEQDMVELAANIPCGTVIDTLFADCSFSDSLYWGAGWSWDDSPYGYQPYLSPLMLCGGAVEVVVTPSSKGEAPCYTCNPKSSFYTIVNEAECGNSELGKLTIMRDWLEDSNVIRIKGNCVKRVKERMNMYKSADFFMAVLMEKLDSLGVMVNNVAFGPSQGEVVAKHSTPLTAVVSEALMESDNLCAEALLYHLCAPGSSAPATMKGGCKVVENFIKGKLGVTCSFSVADGSGLSLYNYTTADILARALRYIYGNKRIFSKFYGSLPLSGVSGTLKNRTKGTVAYKKVRAKTGTVKGVCTLAGYARASNGHMIAFVMLNTGMQSARPVREWQDKACEIICR